MIYTQNVTGQILEIFLTATDHLTGATGQSPTFWFSKNGATTFASATQAVTEMQFGWYKCALATNNIDTLGTFAVHATATKADDSDAEHQIGPIPVNVTQWATGAVPTPNQTGRPLVDLSHINGTAATTGAAQLGVNVYSWATATGLVTVNVVGLPRVDLVDIAGAAVSTSSAQLGVNVIQAATVGWRSGSITSAVFAADAVDSNAIAASAVTEIQTGLATPTNITAGTITTVTTVTTVNGFAAGAITAAALATAGVDKIADQVWDELAAGHTATTSFGAIVQALGAGADPWGTALPGAYAAGSAGFIVGTNLDTTVSSRSTATVGPTATVIADAILDRDMSIGTDSGSSTVRTPRQAFRILRNKISATATTGILSVFKEDDATPSWTSQLQTDSTASPITGSDPV